MSENDQYTNKAKILTSVDFNRSHLSEGGLKTSKDDFYVVWFSKVLGNWKALVSTDVVDDQYWEVTYNGEKKEAYVDHYTKFANHKYIDALDETPEERKTRRAALVERNYEFRSIPGVSDSIKVSRDGEVEINGQRRYDMNAKGIPRHDGSYMSVQMAIHLSFPDIPMRETPSR